MKLLVRMEEEGGLVSRRYLLPLWPFFYGDGMRGSWKGGRWPRVFGFLGACKHGGDEGLDSGICEVVLVICLGSYNLVSEGQSE